MIKKKIIIISILCLAVLISMIIICGTGVWIGSFKYRFNPLEKKAYFINYRGDGNDILPYEVDGYDVEMTDFICMVGNYKCRFNVEPDEVYIKSFEGKGEFVLPAKLLGRNVFNMDRIENNSNISSAYIENNPNNENWGVDIRKCKNVESVIFEEGTKIIRTDVCGSPKLKTLTFPDGVEEIYGVYANNGLEEVYFPKSVVYVDGSDYNGTNFVKNHKNEKYYVVGDNVLLFYNGPIDEMVIPDGIKYLYNYHLFDDEGEEIVEKIYFGDSICGLSIEVPKNCEAYFGMKEINGLAKNSIEGTLVAPEGSYIQQYCKDNGLKFRVMTDEEKATWKEKTEAAAAEITYQK